MDRAQTYVEYHKTVLKQLSLWASLKRGFATRLALLADLVAIVGALATPWIVQAERQVFAALLILSILASVTLIATLRLHWLLPKNAGYGHSLAFFHLAIHILRDEVASPAQWTEQRFKSCLQEVLSAFATAFSIILDAPCRACIKSITLALPEGKQLESVSDEERINYSCARTLCRDGATMRQIGHLAEGVADAPIRHNTAFRFLFEDVRQRYFLGNNLPKMKSYENTSIHKYAKSGDEQWPLPYRATMVWPIRVVTEQACSDNAGSLFTGHQDIMGYLAVDTTVTDAFRPEMDFEAGALMADALYIFFRQVIPQIKENSK